MPIDVIRVVIDDQETELTLLEAISLKIQLKDYMKDCDDPDVLRGLRRVMDNLTSVINKAQGPVADALRGNANASKTVLHGPTDSGLLGFTDSNSNQSPDKG